jgi:hypothetical protein
MARLRRRLHFRKCCVLIHLFVPFVYFSPVPAHEGFLKANTFCRLASYFKDNLLYWPDTL